MCPEKGYASVCGCTVCLGVYVEGGDKFSSRLQSMNRFRGLKGSERVSFSLG